MSTTPGLGDVLQEHDDPPGSVDEVHGAAHALDQLVGMAQLAKSPFCATWFVGVVLMGRFEDRWSRVRQG